MQWLSLEKLTLVTGSADNKHKDDAYQTSEKTHVQYMYIVCTASAHVKPKDQNTD